MGSANAYPESRSRRLLRPLEWLDRASGGDRWRLPCPTPGVSIASRGVNVATISILSLVTSVIALLVSWRQAVKTRKLTKATQRLTSKAQDWSMSDSIDQAITGILQVQLEHPEFRSKDSCDVLMAKASEDRERLRLEAYTVLVYNTLEILFEKYGESKLRGSSFFPAMQTLAKRHHDGFIGMGLERDYNAGMLGLLLRDRTVNSVRDVSADSVKR